LNINFQSIKNKQHLVHNILDSLKPDIVIGTEIWLNPNIKDAEAFSDEYKLYRRDHKGQQGGGVLLAINKNFISDEVEELHPGNDFEIIWAKLENKGSKTLYISSFYNPKTSDEKSLKNFDISVRTSQIKNAALFIGGDFNLPGWDWKNRILISNAVHSKNHYEFGNTLDDTGLLQLIEQPTRQDNTLDLMITN
jgi:exonuclease III